MNKLPTNAVRAVVAVVVLAIVAVGVYFAFFGGGSDKKVTAQFASAIGVYKGTPVRILGVNVGHVTGVQPGGQYVTVTMVYDDKYELSADAHAIEVANSLVSDRYIQLTPLFDKSSDSRALATGAVIPLTRTQGPAELDDVYAALDTLARALGPQGANKGGQHGPLSTLLKVASANLKGNGQALGQTISKLSAAAQTLANNRGDLFGVVRNLQKFTSALHASDGQIRLFNQQLAQVASDLASERTDLGAALHDLTLALDDVSRFVRQNRDKFHQDITGLEDITGILVKEKSSLNETLSVAPIALANLVHTYQPDIGAIATRSNLASLSSTKNDSAQKILCSVLTLAPIDLSAVCPGDSGSTGGLLGGGGSSGGNNLPGIGIPGLIGAGS
ncbi:MAG TPA: MCE family protein [Jatrophihabitans sp.]|nr:MCE family protein [Jatrophihabitans sp.]